MLSRFKRAVFRSAGRFPDSCDIRDTIVLAGSPRSGTTWLLELLSLLPGYKALNEPLHHEEVRTQGGFTRHTVIGPGEARPRQRACMHEILKGRVALQSAWHFDAKSRVLQLAEHARRRKVVVNFCRAGRMLQWLSSEFEVRGLLLIIRHPCAVVSSMLRHPGWRELEPQRWLHLSIENGQIPIQLQEEFGDVLERVRSPAEFLAMRWCLDYYIPFYLHRATEKPWILTTYEGLVVQKVQELERIMDALGAGVTQEMRSKFDKPSASVVDEVPAEAQEQLGKWKRRLSEQQVSSILQIVKAFDLDFYSTRLEPDYDKLRQYTPRSWSVAG